MIVKYLDSKGSADPVDVQDWAAFEVEVESGHRVRMFLAGAGWGTENQGVLFLSVVKPGEIGVDSPASVFSMDQLVRFCLENDDMKSIREAIFPASDGEYMN